MWKTGPYGGKGSHRWPTVGAGRSEAVVRAEHLEVAREVDFAHSRLSHPTQDRTPSWVIPGFASLVTWDAPLV